VKRVIASPANRIHWRTPCLVNGQPLPRVTWCLSPRIQTIFAIAFRTQLYTDPGVESALVDGDAARGAGRRSGGAPGEYFVMGDNRNFSRDSRYWDSCRKDHIVGRPFVIYFFAAEALGYRCCRAAR